MPFTALSPDRSTRYVLPGASDVEKSVAGVIELDGTDPRARDVICPDAHCEGVRLVYRQGERMRAHWAHPRGSGDLCAYEGGMSAWHAWVQLGVLSGAIGHEHTIPGARADVVISTSSKRRSLAAVEVQHSPIPARIVRRRHAAHAEAGLQGTIWIVDGAALGLTPAGWTDEDEKTLGHDWRHGLRGTVIRTRWIVDLIEACMEDSPETGHPSTVGILIETRSGHVMRFVDRARVLADSDGARVAFVTEWSRPYTEAALRTWSHGPRADVPDEVKRAVLSLRQAHTRRVKFADGAFHIRPRGEKVRIAFERHNTRLRDEGERLGLEWKPGRWTSPDGSVSVEPGRLVGCHTEDVAAWLVDRFGWAPPATVAELSDRRRLELPDAEAA